MRKAAIGVQQCIHGGKILEIVRSRGGEFLDFSANLNPIGLPEKDIIDRIIVGAMEQTGSYPDNRYTDFKAAAADFTGVRPDNIVPGNGSSEIIRLVAEAILDEGDTVLVPRPTFEEYKQNIRLMGAVLEQLDYMELYRRLGSISESVLTGAKALIICNPNNPTGTLINRSRLEELAERCLQTGTFLVMDEAFIELSDPSQSLAGLVNTNPFVIIIRSLTKTFAIPGMRIGFGIAHPDVICRLDAVRVPWNLGTIPVAVGTYLLDAHSKDPSYLDRSRRLIKKERDWLMGRLSMLRGFDPVPGAANFILIKIRDFVMDSNELTSRMLDNGILIRDCESFEGLGKDHIRVAVRTHKENQRLVDAFYDVLTQWAKDRTENNIEQAVRNGRVTGRTNCEYYPCHFEGQDCTFCFCPFYPCMDERTGGEMIERSVGGQVWSCAGCDLVHRPEVAVLILKALMSKGNEDLKRIWQEVVESLL